MRKLRTRARRYIVGKYYKRVYALVGRDITARQDAALLKQKEQLVSLLSVEMRKYPQGSAERALLYDMWNKVRLHETADWSEWGTNR